jgi:hypothetical protein
MTSRITPTIERAVSAETFTPRVGELRLRRRVAGRVLVRRLVAIG